MLGVCSLRDRARRSRGFTLPELLTVVVIVGLMSALAMYSFSRAGNDSNAAALARGVQFAMLRARTEALSDGFARKLTCGPTAVLANGVGTYNGCYLYAATNKGLSPAGWVDAGNSLQSSSHALIWNVTAVAKDVTGNAGATATTLNTSITFFPNGATSTTTSPVAPTGATVYICDKTGTNKYKVYAFGNTGLAKLVTTW